MKYRILVWMGENKSREGGVTGMLFCGHLEFEEPGLFQQKWLVGD